MTSSNLVRQAVRNTLLFGGTTAAAVTSLPVLSAEEVGKEMTEVIVTGSRVRRVDEETASPVFVIDQAAIQQSGVTSVGDLVARIPAIAGAATNPSVNNGGGFGESNIELRGLDAKRTLILVDGRRIGLVGASDATDVNQIPLNMIERVEVLKEGAGAVYGSDAIAGVVNFITRKNFTGAEVHSDFGQTSESDGRHYSVDLTIGGSGDKWSFLAGGNFFRQDPVSAGARDFSKYALYLYGGTYGSYQGGSSRSPAGRIFLPANLFETTSANAPGFGSAPQTKAYNCLTVTQEQTLVTKNASAATPKTPDALLAAQQISVTRLGAGSALTDYGCFGQGSNPGKFNYQPDNLLITPQERGALFTKVNYNVNEHLEVYANVLYNRTHSGFQIAALPFDSQIDDVIISKNNIYNPFGIDFGGLAAVNPEAEWRLSSLGDRRSDTTSDSKIVNGGLKGSIMDTGWEWDLNLAYSRLDQHATTYGYLLKPLLQPAFGPSGLLANVDPNNPTTITSLTTQVVCGNSVTQFGGQNAVLPSQQINGCTPVNPFNLSTPAQIAALKTISTLYNTDNTYRYKAATLDLNGKIVDLPAGALQASVGAEYSSNEGVFTADSIVQASPPLYLTCLIANEACTGDSSGYYNTRQMYAELFVPLVKDVTGVKALNVDIGARYSDYSLFGSTTRYQFKLEYRPVSDLLIRGTWSQVYRVPTILDISQAPQNTSVTFSDPCQGLTQADVNANPNLALACVNVPRDGSFKQPNGQITGVNTSNPNLKPETGNVFTVGGIYDVSQVPGLSFEIDYWNYNIKDLINSQTDATLSITQCVQTGDPRFCGLVTRNGATSSTPGGILVFLQPTLNLGELKTNGVDLGIRYSLKDTSVGSFQTNLDVTRINSYEDTPAPGAPSEEIVGTYNRNFGNYAQYRGMLNVGWDFHGLDALFTVRYIHHLVLKDPAASHVTEDGVTPYPDLPIPSMTYLDFTLGYTLPTQTKIQVGIQNIADKQPPILYQNNVANANTDVQTYDTLGQRFWVGLTQKF